MRVEFTNLVDLLEISCARYENRPLLGTKHKQTWTWTTYGEFRSLVDQFRGALASLEVAPGDKVAIISDNRLEWAVTCYATYGLGAVLVPMYQSQRPQEWEFILRDCGARVVIGATAAIADRLESLRESVPSLEHVVGLDWPPDHPQSFASLMRRGARLSPVRTQAISPETIAGFIYTSGTTGTPKGVILSHANMATNVSAVSSVFPLEPDDRSLSFLPWAHSYGQCAELHYLVSQGASTAINDALPQLIENLAEVRPTILVAVPRIFSKIYANVNREISEKPAIVQRMFHDGIRAAKLKAHGERPGFLAALELAIDDPLIFRKVRAKFGGRLRFAISASAALNPEVAEFIDALGITVYEGYGLTETSPVVSANSPGHRKPGSAGRVIPGVRVVIDESADSTPGRGEIIVYGPNVMRGYHNRDDENARVFTADGGFRTGDIGHIDADGYLFIAGRKKEEYKLENGKYVIPTLLEEQLKTSPYILNVMVHGANRPYNLALVVPDPDALERFAVEQNIQITNPATDPRVRQLLEREIREHATGLRSFEIPRKVVVIGEEFTTANGLLTPTLKLKRGVAEERFRGLIDAAYAEPEQRESAPASAT